MGRTYRLPIFNLTCDVYRQVTTGHAALTPSIVGLLCSLDYASLKTSKGSDVRVGADQPNGLGDLIRLPPGGNTWYLVDSFNPRHCGWPNAYDEFYVTYVVPPSVLPRSYP